VLDKHTDHTSEIFINRSWMSQSHRALSVFQDRRLFTSWCQTEGIAAKSPLDSGLNLSRAHPVLGFCCNLERFDFPASRSKTVSCYHSRVMFVPHTTMLAGRSDTLHRICLLLRETLLTIIICAFMSMSPMAAFQLSAFLVFTSLFSQTQTHTSGQPDPSYLSACECQTHTHTHMP